MPPAVQPAAQPNSSTPPPQSYGDERQWAELEAELADELKEGEEPPAKEEPESEPEQGAEPPQEEPAKPSYEQLESSYRNMHAALREGREREREAREQLRNISQVIESLRGRREAPAEKAEPKGPSKEEDPIGYFEHRIAQLERTNQELRTGTQETQQAVAQSQQEQVFWAHVDRSEAEAKARLPDYGDAVKFLEQSRWDELRRMYPDDHPGSVAMARQQGFNSPADMRMAVLNQDRIAVATQAIQLGVSPAQFYYDLAKGRGYQSVVGKAPGAQPGVRQQRGPDNWHDEPLAQQQRAAEAKIETARNGQRASRSLSGSGGRTPNIPNVAGLIELYEDDPVAFDDAWDKMARSGKLG